MNGHCPRKTLSLSFALSLAVSASIALSPAFSATQSYSDVKQSWAQDSIQKMVKQNVMPGFNDGMFHPNAWVTRTEFGQMTAGALGLPTPQADTIPVLQDIGRNAWQFQPVQDQSVLSAYPPGVFQPENPLRRVEALAAMAGVLNKPLVKQDEADRILGRYADADQIPADLRQAVATAIQYRLFAVDPQTPQAEGASTGLKRTGKNIDPLRPITRAETAVLLSNLYERRDITIVRNGQLIAPAAATIGRTGQQPLVGAQTGETSQGVTPQGGTAQGITTPEGTTSQSMTSQGTTTQGLNTQSGTTSQSMTSQGLNTQSGTTSQSMTSQGLNTPGVTTPDQSGVPQQGAGVAPEAGTAGPQSTETQTATPNQTSLSSQAPSSEITQGGVTSPGGSVTSQGNTSQTQSTLSFSGNAPTAGVGTSSVAGGQTVESQTGQQTPLANAQTQESPQGITTKTQGTSMVRGSETGETGETGKTTAGQTTAQTGETATSGSHDTTTGGLAPTAAGIDFYQGYGTPYRNSADTIREFRTVNATTTPATMDAAALHASSIPMNVSFTGTVAKALYTAFNKPGDPVMVILDHPLNGTDGRVIAPAGSKVLGLVTRVQSYNRTGDPAELGLTFNGIITPDGQRIPVSATVNNADGILKSGALQGVVFHPNRSVDALKREISTAEGGLYGTKVGKAYVLEEPLVSQVSDQTLDAMDIHQSEIVIGIGDRLHLRSIENSKTEGEATRSESPQTYPATTTPSDQTEQQQPQQTRPEQQ